MEKKETQNNVSNLTAEERAEIKFISANIKVMVYYGQSIEKESKTIAKLIEDKNDKIIKQLENLNTKFDQLLRKWYYGRCTVN